MVFIGKNYDFINWDYWNENLSVLFIIELQLCFQIVSRWRFQVKGIEKYCRFVGSPKTLKSYISAGQRFQKKSLNKKFAFYLNYKM